MKKKTTMAFLILIACSFFVSTGNLQAAPYYEGKVLKIIVSFPPGGGYDRIARILAKHLPKYIPGKPTIIIENMPGASGMIGANYLYNIAKPDGLTIGTINRAIPSAQLLKIEGVKFDMLKYSWVGSAAVEASVLVVRSDLPYKTFEDMKKVKETINVGATGPGDLTYNFETLLKQFLGLNMKIVSGYTATTDIILAIERKEVEGMGIAYSSILPHIARGLVRPVVRTKVSKPGIEKLPAAEDITTDKMGKTILAMFSVADRVGRPFLGPPGIPADVLKVLREAFSKVSDDPEAKQEAEKAMMEIDYVPADECLKEMQFFFNQPSDVVNEFKKYIKF